MLKSALKHELRSYMAYWHSARYSKWMIQELTKKYIAEVTLEMQRKYVLCGVLKNRHIAIGGIHLYTVSLSGILHSSWYRYRCETCDFMWDI